MTQLSSFQFDPPLQQLDIANQLASIQSAVDALQRQFAARSRDQEDARLQADLRFQEVERRQSDADNALVEAEARIDEALSQTAEDIEELRRDTRNMMSQVVSRIADQFDAVQGTLDDAIAARAAETAAQGASVEALKTSVQQMNDLLGEMRNAADAMRVDVGDHAARLTAVEEGQHAAELRESSASELMQEALTTWQGGVEERLDHAIAALTEYKKYVGRLRSEVNELRNESEHAAGVLIDAITRELGGAGGGVATLQRDAGVLLGQFQLEAKGERG
jgi:hypothetical protein